MNHDSAVPVTASSRTNILQIVGNAIVGGMENYVVRLVERLPRDRFGVSVLAPFESPFTDQLRNVGADVFITPVTDEPSWQSIQLASALIQSRSIDVIQSHLPNAHVLAALAGRLSGRPVLATVHGRALTTLDLEVHKLAGTQLAVVCRHSYFQALGIGIDPRHVHYLPNGVDTERFRPQRVRDGALRTKFGIAAQTPLVGFIGRLSTEKGPDLFLRMALSVRAQVPSAEFVLVGDGAMLKQLQTFAKRFGLADAVHFAGNQSDMPAVLNELDVVVSSSHSEAMPLAVMEAMASGVPVVACKVGGIPDLVAHGVTGWLVDAGDVETLATRVVELLDDDALRSAAGAAARARAVDRMRLDQSVDATTRLLLQLVAQREPARRFGTLHEAARPIRTNGSAVKAAAAAQR
ncbi:MAG TPA: glycosyltransferase [Caldimonas sp.]|nr:glycosyltransferase [Caldimonas sp.]